MTHTFRTRRFAAVPPDERPRRARRATRIVVTDGTAVLLFADTDPGIPGSRWWITPGGGIDPGETELDAGVRELFEETGLQVTAADLGRPVMRRRVVHGYSDQILTQDETFFVLRVARFAPDLSRHTPDEQLTLTGHRWIDLDALSDVLEPVWPDDLPRLVAQAAEPDAGVLDLGVVEESTLPAEGTAN